MTSIDTYVAAKHWKGKGGEIKFLEAIEFIALDEYNKISISTDEEGNDFIVLTPKAARWLAKHLLELADVVEKYEIKNKR